MVPMRKVVHGSAMVAMREVVHVMVQGIKGENRRLIIATEAIVYWTRLLLRVHNAGFDRGVL